VIGETLRSASLNRSRNTPDHISIDQWIARHITPRGPNAEAGARSYVGWISELGGSPELPRAQGSIAAAFVGEDGKAVYPLHLRGQGGVVSLSFRYLLKRPGLSEEKERRRHYEAFKRVLGNLSTSSLTGSPGFPIERLADPQVRTALYPAALEFIAAARQA
jgi:hypothetical protein